MSQANGPTLFPSVDTITIAGVVAPGQWILVRADKVYGFDVRKQYAGSGATVVPTGDELVEAEFEVRLWDSAQVPLFRALRAGYLSHSLISVAGAPIAKPFGIDHPELADLGVTAVVVRKITPLRNDEFGLWTCTVIFLQYRRPQPAQPKPQGPAIPDVAPPVPSAQDNLEREAQLLEQQYQAELSK